MLFAAFTAACNITGPLTYNNGAMLGFIPAIYWQITLATGVAAFGSIHLNNFLNQLVYPLIVSVNP